jgi:signal transduction histidine kinase
MTAPLSSTRSVASGKQFPGWLSWVILGVAFLAAVGTGVIINVLSARADESRRLQTALVALQGDAHELNGLEWETISKGKLDEELSERLEKIRSAMNEGFGKLRPLELRLPQLQEVIEKFQTYSDLTNEEFGLLADGKIKEAEALDAAKVDPAFETLHDALEETASAFDNLAARTLGLVRTGTFIVLLAAAGFIATLFWQYHKRRRVGEVAAAEQRILRQANEELEERVRERTAELAALSKKMAAISRKAGMAEVANSVLHNVGNVLNSVNVSVSLVSERLRDTPLADLPNVAELLRTNAADLGAYFKNDPAGRQVPGFVEMLSKHWVTEHGVLVGELARLENNVQHIKEIVNRQQSLSGVSGVVEEVLLPELIEDALAIHADTLKNARVVVHRQFADGPRSICDRVKLTQILVNLIGNAQESLAESLEAERSLTLRTALDGDGGVEIRVIDTGVGIVPEVLEGLFTYGFTTKKGGHGFGLHASALAAHDMGGTLRAESDGRGRGATFIVHLPRPSAAVAVSLAA